MLPRFTLAFAAAAAIVLPGPADAQSNSGRQTVCHRVGNQAINGFFPGHIMEVSADAAGAHRAHGDLLISPELRAKFSSSRVCLRGVDGKLYDQNRTPVEAALPPPPMLPPPPPPPPADEPPPG